MSNAAYIIGAGLSGITMARVLADNGWAVKIFEKRNHIAGNIYDYYDENNVLVQKYGAHLFHTDDENVMAFLKRFTDFYPYFHTVNADVCGKIIPLPFQFDSIRILFPEKAQRLIDILIRDYGENTRVPIMVLLKNKNKDVHELAEFVYNNIFSYYTSKQWGISLDRLDPKIGERVPVVMSDRIGYFTDKYQCMPNKGFTNMAKKIINHPFIDVYYGCDSRDHLKLSENGILWDGSPLSAYLIYTGCVDELLDFRYGQLPYRSLNFDFKKLHMKHFQSCGVVNYTTSEDYTRIIEFKYFMATPPSHNTTIAYEFPCAFDGRNIPYYPVINDENQYTYSLYENDLKKYRNLSIIGRLAQYRYYNMDQAVSAALTLASSLVNSYNK